MVALRIPAVVVVEVVTARFGFSGLEVVRTCSSSEFESESSESSQNDFVLLVVGGTVDGGCWLALADLVVFLLL